MTKKHTRAPKRRAATEEPLPRSTWVAALKADFDAAHKNGMNALERGDYDGVGDAIERERQAIDAIAAPAKPDKRRT